jgi:threonine dehydrogenase-like Zn-dependent dehydrogenase
MRATLMYGAGDVRIENVPDSVIAEPSDALVRVTASCICGSDLHPYASMSPDQGPAQMGHEFIGVVEDIGSEVSTVGKGDLVVAPFAYSDGTCVYCREGAVHLVRARRLLGHPGHRGGPGRSGPRPPGRWHPGRAARRLGLGADARCSPCPMYSAPAITPRSAAG